MFRHVIFDLDGTLVDSARQCIGIVNAMLADRGSDRRVDAATARVHMSSGGQHLVSVLLGTDGGDPAAELADFRARYQAMPTSREALFPGVAEGVAALRRAGLTLAICSNKPQHLCENVLADTGLAPHFAAIVGERPTLRAKPAPDLLLAALKELGGDGRACLYVGDSEIDHELARSADIPFCFMTYGYATPHWSPEAGASFGCFPTLVASIMARLGQVHA
ncbi:HAD-IA family hydrolase [Sphingobium sp. BYY-5]|uniref:HAD family hydrolase n=1 Tax=Sphingobium sp. BYY-5 TaxID=2926400 RepID=UPI001FA7D3AC|nr:HAD-IA family hydrolase [Sphingobium sp. BYY-5]MCI4590448.1 HAD-IA family hydrolase [Sphingobium sp. BYY-5]